MKGHAMLQPRGHSARLMLCTILALSGIAASARAQDVIAPAEDAPEWVKKFAIDTDTSAAKKYQLQQKARVAAEKDLRKLRLKHFGPIKKTELRQEGILKLREYTDPALFPSLIRIFGREEVDVRTATLDIFSESRTNEGDACLTWVGIFDKSAQVRAAAVSRLQSRIKEEGETPDGVKLAVYQGITSTDQIAQASAANLAVDLKILEAIPWLINGQVGQAPGGGAGAGEDRTGDLAWIVVGTQIAFVSDLTPVVGPNAVAFDPELSVVTEGVLLRIHDAVVLAYNVDLHNALNRLGSIGMDGADLTRLGWNGAAWRDWYRNEFLPFQAQTKAAAAAAAPPTDAAPATTPAKDAPAKDVPPPGKG
jgi:hypothetical protein